MNGLNFLPRRYMTIRCFSYDKQSWSNWVALGSTIKKSEEESVETATFLIQQRNLQM